MPRVATRCWSRISIAAAAAALVILGAACAEPTPSAAPPSQTSAGSPSDSFTGELFDLLNSARAARGLPALAWDDQLASQAASWSSQMASRGSLVHEDLGSVLSSPGWEEWQSLGENILDASSSTSAERVHQMWMDSPVHLQNIVGTWDSAGIGYDIRDGTVWVTELFGRHF